MTVHRIAIALGLGLTLTAATALAQETPVSTPAPEPAVTVPAPAESCTSPCCWTDCARPDGWSFHAIGSAWTRYELRDNYAWMSGPQADTGEDYLMYQMRPGFESDPFNLRDGATATVRIVPQGSAYTRTGVTGNDGNVSLHEGFASIETSNYTLQAGRFEMYYGEGILVGPSFWHYQGRAFDGFRMSFDPGFGLDIFATQVHEAAPYPRRSVPAEIGSSDAWFNGIYAQLGPMVGEGIDLDLYAYHRFWARDHIVTTTTVPGENPGDPDVTVTTQNELDDANEITLGARFAGASGSIDYALEADYQMGQRATFSPSYSMVTRTGETDVAAYSADLVAGFTAPSGMRLHLNGFFASGNDPETADVNEGFDRLFGQSHKFLGQMDIVGHRTNVAGVSFGYSQKFNNRWIVGADAYYFMRPHLAVDGEDGMNAFGEEIDLSLKYIFGRGVALQTGYGLFLPADDYVMEVPAHFFQLMLVTKF